MQLSVLSGVEPWARVLVGLLKWLRSVINIVSVVSNTLSLRSRSKRSRFSCLWLCTSPEIPTKELALPAPAGKKANGKKYLHYRKFSLNFQSRFQERSKKVSVKEAHKNILRILNGLIKIHYIFILMISIVM